MKFYRPLAFSISDRCFLLRLSSPPPKAVEGHGIVGYLGTTDKLSGGRIHREAGGPTDVPARRICASRVGSGNSEI